MTVAIKILFGIALAGFVYLGILMAYLAFMMVVMTVWFISGRKWPPQKALNVIEIIAYYLIPWSKELKKGKKQLDED